MLKRALYSMTVGLTLACAAHGAAAENYPSKGIEIVVPVTPGSGTDLIARAIAEEMTKRLDTNVIVLNKPGAASQIAAAYVQRAKPDGYTLLIIHSGVIANPMIYKSFTIDMRRDLTPVAAISQTPWVVAIHDSVPAKTMGELVAYSKANPGKINVGVTGGSSELDIAMLRSRTGLDAEVIMYPGGTQVMTALASNEIQVALNAIRGVETMAERGVRALASTSDKRFSLAPGLPTLGESGVPAYEGVSLWFGLLGPAGMPDDIVRKLNGEVNEILRLPAVAKRLETMAHEPMGGTPNAFSDLIESNTEFYEQAAKQAGIVPR